MSALPSSEPLSVAATLAFMTATVAYSLLAQRTESHIRAEKARATAPVNIRKKLPNDLYGWRNQDSDVVMQDTHWEALRVMFAERGYTLWEREEWSPYMFYKPGGNDVAQNGFAYATALRKYDDGAGGLISLYRFQLQNHSCHVATAADGRFVVIRVLKVGDEGQRHLDILRSTSRGPTSLYSNNYTLPFLQEIQVEDIIFGVFPYVGHRMREAYHYWAQNSVGDLVDMVLQMLAALSYIHARRIVHRDAFKDNFLVQWQPETLKGNSMPVLRPRVYLHDFEGAVQFPRGCPVEEQVLVGLPCGSWTGYARPSPPEVLSGAPYNPYKVDVWQLGTSLSDMKTTITDIDEILVDMMEPDASKRMTAILLVRRLKAVIHGMIPSALNIPPVITEPDCESAEDRNSAVEHDQP